MSQLSQALESTSLLELEGTVLRKEKEELRGELATKRKR
jgi:hypothetical protein